jgi:hypothetical protein
MKAGVEMADFTPTLMELASQTHIQELLHIAVAYCLAAPPRDRGETHKRQYEDFLRYLRSRVSAKGLPASHPTGDSRSSARNPEVEYFKNLRSVSPQTRKRIRKTLADGFDNVNRQGHLVDLSKRRGHDNALATALLTEMRTTFRLMRESSHLIRRRIE